MFVFFTAMQDRRGIVKGFVSLSTLSIIFSISSFRSFSSSSFSRRYKTSTSFQYTPRSWQESAGKSGQSTTCRFNGKYRKVSLSERFRTQLSGGTGEVKKKDQHSFKVDIAGCRSIGANGISDRKSSRSGGANI
jgi:hypothetical protein